jgi:K+-sensing histidine kinase KdpD
MSLTIIKDHNGTIEASGAENNGATFTVRLPLEQKHTAPDSEKDSL